MHLCNVTSSTTIWYAPLRREKRRSALLESNRPRDIPQGLIKTMAPGGAGHTPAPPPPAHRIDRPLHALKNSFMKMALKDGKYPQNVPFGNILKGGARSAGGCVVHEPPSYPELHSRYQ